MNCPHWLLALTIPFSRSDRAHTIQPVLVPGVPKDCSGRIARRKVSFGCRRAREAVPTGVSPYQARALTVNAFCATEIRPGTPSGPGPLPRPIVAGHPAARRGCPPERPGSPGPRHRPPHTAGGMR